MPSNFLTIIARTEYPDEKLGVDKYSSAYYDGDHTAHARYGVSTVEGEIAVVRPDGILADGSRTGKMRSTS
jgi:hypothetical protein